VRVSVQWPASRALVVEDVETGKAVTAIPAGATGFPVQFTTERVRLLRISPR